MDEVKQEDTGVRYCPKCGKPDQADWRKYNGLIGEQWINADDD